MKKVKVISRPSLMDKQFIQRVRKTKAINMKRATILNKKTPLPWEVNLARINQKIAEIKKLYGI